VLVPPYDDPLVMPGRAPSAARSAEEIARLGHELDCVIVNASAADSPAGMRSRSRRGAPAAKIYTAEPAGFDDHARSFAAASGSAATRP